MRPFLRTNERNHNNLPILNQSNSGYSEEILDKLFSLLLTYMAKHCKGLFIRFDLHFEQTTVVDPSNHTLDRFLQLYKLRLRRQGLDPMLLWVREQSNEDRSQHYHLIVLVDGNKTQNAFPHLELAKEVWGNVNMKNENSSTVNFCTQDRYGNPQVNGIMIRRSPDGIIQEFKRCYQWGSYLAKFETKGLAPMGVRETGCSNVTSYNQVTIESLDIQLQ